MWSCTLLWTLCIEYDHWSVWLTTVPLVNTCYTAVSCILLGKPLIKHFCKKKKSWKTLRQKKIFKYLNNKKVRIEHIGLMRNEQWKLAASESENADVLNCLLVSLYKWKTWVLKEFSLVRARPLFLFFKNTYSLCNSTYWLVESKCGTDIQKRIKMYTRPMNLSIVCKVLEGIVMNCIQSFSYENGIISTKQHSCKLWFHCG